jgi:hypothetical protein
VSLQSTATCLAHTENRPPTITISSDVACIAIEGRQLCLETWRRGLRELYDDTELKLKKLLRNHSFTITVPENLADDQTDDIRGRGWLDKGPFTAEPKPLMKVLLEDESQPVAMRHCNSLRWIPGNMVSFMQDASEIIEQLAVLNHIVNAPALRGVEFLDCKIRNSTLQRNYYIDHGKDVFITMRTKPDGPRDAVSYIPVYPPPLLQDLNRRYLILVRPVEVELAEKLWGKESAVLYREYFYVFMGSSLYPRFSAVLSRKLVQYAGIDQVGLHDWRQLSVAIKREFIRPEYDTENEFDDISDTVSGHTTSTAILNYAVQHGYHPTLTTDRLLRYQLFCGQWWNVCGFGTKVPVPLRLQSIAQSRALLQREATSVPPSNDIGFTLGDSCMRAISDVIGNIIEKKMEKIRAEFEDTVRRVVTSKPYFRLTHGSQ